MPTSSIKRAASKVLALGLAAALASGLLPLLAPGTSGVAGGVSMP